MKRLSMIIILLSIFMFAGCTPWFDDSDYDSYESGQMGTYDDYGPIPLRDYEHHTKYTITHKDWGYRFPYGIPDECPEFDVETTGGYFFIVDNEDGLYIGISNELENGDYGDGITIDLRREDWLNEKEAKESGWKIYRSPSYDDNKEGGAETEHQGDEYIELGDSGYYLDIHIYDKDAWDNLKITVHEG